MNKSGEQNLPRQALHRKWRSRDFNEIYGQEHVVKTLKNAIASGRIAQAYLFSGPRGTGKTSMARILAKAVNCPNVEQGQPCNQCHVCREINAGSFLDVIEMDAASHTQVDKIREFIVEKVNFRPTQAKKKIYIIDEVHKLSSYAFDALLKTIEEPPPFVIFILATTEPEKLPPTILSRCQRFDFKRIPVKLIVDRLRMISEIENFDIEDGALNLIAQASDGALRDALVILEQAVSFSEETVRTGDIISLLGMTLTDSLFTFADLVLEKGTRQALEFVDQMYRDGKDLHRLAVDLLEHFRRLLLIRMVGEAETILEITPDLYSRLSEQAFRFKTAHLLHIIRELMELRQNLREFGMERILWEMSVVKLTRWEVSPSVESLNKRLGEVEKKIEFGVVKNLNTGESAPGASKSKLRPSPAQSVGIKGKPTPSPYPKNATREKPQESPPEEKMVMNVDESSIWHQFLRVIQKEKFNLLPILQEVGPGKLKEKEYLLKVDPQKPFNRNLLEQHRKYLEDVLKRVSGVKLRLRFEHAKIEKLFDRQEKSHKAFVQEVSDMFGASDVDQPV